MPAPTAVGRTQNGTAKVFKTSGGDAAISCSGVTNGSARQSVKADMQAAAPNNGTFAGLWLLEAIVDTAATPTAGNTVDFYGNPSSSATAGTDNKGGCNGTDAAYTGIASDLAASLKQLVFLGSLICTSDVTQQAGVVGTFRLLKRYLSIVAVNNSGSSFAASTNTVITMTPLEDTSEPS